MKEKVLHALNTTMGMLSLLMIGFGLGLKTFYLKMLENLTEDAQVIRYSSLFCYTIFIINSMMLILSLIGHVSRWLNRKMVYLLLLIFVFSTAILLLVVLGLSVGVFSNFIPTLAPLPETTKDALLSNDNIKTFMVIYILNLGVDIIVLIITGIVATMLFCGKKIDSKAEISQIPKSELSRFAVPKEKRAFTSFQYTNFGEENKEPLTVNDLRRSQHNIVTSSTRKLPDLPLFNNFKPVSYSTRRNPSAVRSAPNLHRLENVILINSDSKTDDSTADSNESAPLIKKQCRTRHYDRRKQCSSVTEESDVIRDADFANLRLLTRPPIGAIDESPPGPFRPHHRQKSQPILSENLNQAMTKSDVDAEVNRLLYSSQNNSVLSVSGNKELCKTRLISVPEPSEIDDEEESNNNNNEIVVTKSSPFGYSEIKTASPVTLSISMNSQNQPEIVSDSICHV
ncbi:Oidioi.mRNA.OKI2018_I69.chr2.g4241.t1.cds [Oikopleura dioica]|uniref:Oidioi.mRNA.OKI2018_I69.chr2.g4241.t1.cds n=1 Tax=Oikopleura dioica TaxID=34765 RepID=A0ABN7SX67_OIKDI|nr:Oidioi.mRNA.OKI2018_I69.chr2.g4241.t1.cds [Oikopleura dioica]